MSLDQLKDIIPSTILSSFSDLHYTLAEGARNPRICGILDETVLTAGKRLRPLLTFLVGDLLGLSHAAIAPYAIDIERIHAATLAHDDVVDNAVTRRGQATLNAVASNKKAILAGDYLLAQVLQDVASRGDPVVVKEIARVIADLVEGEWLQIENAQKVQLVFADVERVALKKTGSVIRWCCLAPFLLAGAKSSLLDLATSFGESLGVAFQLGDDLLDFKRQDGSAFADLDSGVISSVIFYLASCDGLPLDATQVNFSKLPRETHLVEKATASVRQKLDEHLTKAAAAFRAIQQQLPGLPTSGAETTRAFEALLTYLAER